VLAYNCSAVRIRLPTNNRYFTPENSKIPKIEAMLFVEEVIIMPESEKANLGIHRGLNSPMIRLGDDILFIVQLPAII